MILDLLSLIASSIGGGMVGAITVLVWTKRQKPRQELSLPYRVTTERGPSDDQIRDVAAQWCAAHDREAMTDIVANKLRVRVAATARRQAGPRSWRS